MEAFAQTLRRAGFDAFMDTGLTGGQRWWDELLHQIQDCEAFVPILTKSYHLSQPCKLEAKYATDLAKPFLPIQVESSQPETAASSIVDVQWVPYSTLDAESFLDVVRALHGLPASPPLPDELPEPTARPSFLLGRVD